MAATERSVCPHDCSSACALLVMVENGRLGEVTGNPAHPCHPGIICGKVRAYAERVHSPLRALHPLRRVGAKGAGRFEAIPREAAIEEIAGRWRRIIASDGAEAILPFSYAGTASVMRQLLSSDHPTRMRLSAPPACRH